MHRTTIAASATLALISTAASAAVASASAPAPRAVHYLTTNQQADGSLDGSPGETEDLVIGAVAVHIAPAALHAPGSSRTALTYLAAVETSSPATTPGTIAKLALAIEAGGANPAAFAGHDLLHDLAGTFHAGAYGDGSTFGQSLAILALRGAGRSVPATAIAHLVHNQDSDGSWNFTAGTTTQGDTNSTAIAVQALAASGHRAPLARALAYLHSEQQSDGGFPYQSPSQFGVMSDPDSDALVLQALVAAGQNPRSAAWQVSGHTPMQNLLAFQASDGGFTFPGNSSPDTFTTSEVPAGLALAPLPVRP